MCTWRAGFADAMRTFCSTVLLALAETRQEAAELAKAATDATPQTADSSNASTGGADDSADIDEPSTSAAACPCTSPQHNFGVLCFYLHPSHHPCICTCLNEKGEGCGQGLGSHLGASRSKGPPVRPVAPQSSPGCLRRAKQSSSHHRARQRAVVDRTRHRP